MGLSTAGGCCALAALLTVALPGAGAAGAGEVTMPSRAVWIWGKTVREAGAEQVAARLAAARIDTALVLVKGLAGQTAFASDTGLQPAASGDTLRDLLAACPPRGIRVHAWFMYHGDMAWVKAHPDEALHSCGDDPHGTTKPSDEKICPAAPGYRAYLQQVMREMLAAYPVDGLHLDGIRYPTLSSCFCPRHRDKARELGIDFDKVRRAAIKTYHDDAGRTYLIDLYQRGDPEVRRWVDMRREEIDSFVRETAQLLREARPAAQLSAALMPEGAAPDDAFALCHYAQDYRTVGAACDFICPMSYHASFGQPAIWPADVAALAATRSGRPALAGLQAFQPSTPADLQQALAEVARRHQPGFVIFNYEAITAESWALLSG